MLMALRFAGQAKEEQELLGQLANVKAVVELNARLLGTEEVKVWMMAADPRRTPKSHRDLG